MALTRTQIVDEALRLADEKGLDGLSLRALAARLDVQAPTLYWHVPNKAALLDAVSDAIMGEALDALPGLDDALPTREWLLGALVLLRQAMLRHRDGARIVSGAHDSLRRAEFVELGMRRLIDGGVDERDAWLLMLAATRYALTAERFDGARARELGLLDECYAAEELEEKVEAWVANLLNNSPAALVACKALFQEIGAEN